MHREIAFLLTAHKIEFAEHDLFVFSSCPSVPTRTRPQLQPSMLPLYDSPLAVLFFSRQGLNKTFLGIFFVYCVFNRVRRKLFTPSTGLYSFQKLVLQIKVLEYHDIDMMI